MPLPKFILNDQSRLNSHGFYLLNAGGRFDRFRENPVMLDNHNMNGLVGRWDDLRVEGELLVADPVFDDGVALGAERKGQVERGFLRGASPGIIILAAEWREDEAMYVTEWELMEGSVTPLPSNAGALTLRIFDNNRQPVPDKDVPLHLENIIKLSVNNQNEIIMPTTENGVKTPVTITLSDRKSTRLNSSH